MRTSRSASLSGRSSQNLGQTLTALFTALYKSWYALPKKSTRRHIDIWCEAHASQVAAGTIETSEIARFLDDLAHMTGIQEIAGGELERAKEAAAKPDAFIADDQLRPLSALLAADDPAGYAIQQMVYDPGKVQNLLDEVGTTLTAVADQLPDDIQHQLSAIWADWEAAQRMAPSGFVESREPYTKALQRLEQIPTVIRLTYQLFLEYKVDDESEISTHRGFIPHGGAKSPSGLESGDALEAFIPPRIAAAEAAEEEAVEEAGMLDPASSEAEPKSPLEDEPKEDEPQQFFPDVRFPEQVELRDEVPLIVQFTQRQSQESRVSGMQVGIPFEVSTEDTEKKNAIKEPEYIEVVLSASGFSEQTGIWSRTIMVYADQDSQPAVFLLKAEEQGEQNLTVSFHHQGRGLGQAQISATISGQRTRMGTTPSVVQVAAIAAPTPYAAAPADLELRITKSSGDNKLAFMLHSSKAQVGYHWRPVGEITLAQANPQKYLEGKFERMSQFAGTLTASSTAAEIQETMREIETVGEELFEDLFPEGLKTEFWKLIKPLREKGVIQSLLITSDEPWIPWEMVKPYRYDDITDEEERDGFLCQTFQFCRWLAGRAPTDQVNIQAVKTVIPDIGLSFAQKEQDYFQRVEDESSIQVGEPLKSRNDVLKSARDGGFQLLHFAVHGLFQADQVNQSPLILAGGDELYPEDLSGAQLRGLRKSKPIVFLNACHTARINFALTGLGGWADKMVNDARVSAFIGTLWEVNDELALAFSTKFYDELRAGRALGQAFSNARTHIRELAPANPTWLAYTLYGDPNSRITWSI